MDAESETTVDPVDRYRIVEVLGVLGVDREGEPVAQIDPVMLAQRRLDVERGLLGLLQRTRGERSRETVLADDDVDADRRIVSPADDLFDVALRGLVA